jgi:hypothetical protein
MSGTRPTSSPSPPPPLASSSHHRPDGLFRRSSGSMSARSTVTTNAAIINSTAGMGSLTHRRQPSHHSQQHARQMSQSSQLDHDGWHSSPGASENTSRAPSQLGHHHHHHPQRSIGGMSHHSTLSMNGGLPNGRTGNLRNGNVTHTISGSNNNGNGNNGGHANDALMDALSDGLTIDRSASPLHQRSTNGVGNNEIDGSQDPQAVQQRIERKPFNLRDRISMS